MQSMKFQPVQYTDLNSRQQETYNFQKIAGVLADYGFSSIRLSDDWNGADFIAQHIDGQTFLKVQLKGRLSFHKKYINKGLWLCFMHGSEVILYPHDLTLAKFAKDGRIVDTESWKGKGQYHFPSLGTDVLALIEEYRIRPVQAFG
jgi:hypothetical protein